MKTKYTALLEQFQHQGCAYTRHNWKPLCTAWM